MEPGAGGGSFKFLRGFDPYIVNSVHWFPNRDLSGAVGDFLYKVRFAIVLHSSFLL
jgi:predicted N-acyltransferase